MFSFSLTKSAKLIFVDSLDTLYECHSVSMSIKIERIVWQVVHYTYRWVLIVNNVIHQWKMECIIRFPLSPLNLLTKRYTGPKHKEDNISRTYHSLPSYWLNYLYIHPRLDLFSFIFTYFFSCFRFFFPNANTVPKCIPHFRICICRDNKQ